MRVPTKRACYDGLAVPVADLFVMKNVMLGQELRVLKDDGWNTNILPFNFLKRNKQYLNVKKTNTFIKHFDRAWKEKSSEMIVDTEAEIGNHKYRSNFAIAECRYDILLGISWYNETNPKPDF